MSGVRGEGVAESGKLTLTERAVAGLFCVQRYRFLTINQFARASGLHRITAANKLLLFQQCGLLGYFGNTGLRGYGKTPKAYFLTRKGWELLAAESGIPAELLGRYKEVKVEAAWSPQMYHRLRTVDLLIALESAVESRPHLALVKTFLEYRRLKRGERIVQETTDYVDTEESAENKIIPDAACILENTQTKRRALFFLEMDKATERITSAYIGNKAHVGFQGHRCEDGVNSPHPMSQPMPGVQRCRSISRIWLMIVSVIRLSASYAGQTAACAPRVSPHRSSSVALMTRNPPVSAMRVPTVTHALMI
jgi:hypothetical protein